MRVLGWKRFDFQKGECIGGLMMLGFSQVWTSADDSIAPFWDIPQPSHKDESLEKQVRNAFSSYSF